MTKVLEKVERHLGEKLFLKGERCSGPKCAFVRRTSVSGNRRKGKARKKTVSEYGLLLHEKQKARFFYGLDDHTIERYSKIAAKKGMYGARLLELLESRLDTVVRNLGFALSQRQARQIIKYGHIAVNGRRMTIPSYHVKKNDTISVRERSFALPLFSDLNVRLEKYAPPKWLLLDAQKKQGTVTAIPEEFPVNIDVTKVKEFYSR